MNKTDSAVRITHKPTGIVVQCQNERSQSSNKATAMAMLRSKLLEPEEQKRREEIAQGEGRGAGRGLGLADPLLRAAALHDGQGPPHRTTRWATRSGVLDGDLDGFVRAELLRRAGKASSGAAGNGG